MTFSETCLKSRQTEWRVIRQTKIWQIFITNTLKKPNKFWPGTYSNKTSSFGQLHYMPTGEKTRREANKNIMGIEMKKNHETAATRENQSLFFSIWLVERGQHHSELSRWIQSRVCFSPWQNKKGHRLYNFYQCHHQWRVTRYWFNFGQSTQFLLFSSQLQHYKIPYLVHQVQQSDTTGNWLTIVLLETSQTWKACKGQPE